MESKDLWCVGVGQTVDVIIELSNLGTGGDDVALVEVECRCKHVLPKPDAAECVQETLVKVIRHTPTILNLTKHVAHADPVDTLEEQGNNQSIQLQVNFQNLSYLLTNKGGRGEHMAVFLN